MRTGISGMTVRMTMPSLSSSFSRSERRRSLRPGTIAVISLNRVVPESMARRIAPVHRLPMSSTA
jgi:hypothetical protein